MSDPNTISLIGGILKAGGQTYEYTQQSAAAKQAQKEQQAQYTELSKLQDPTYLLQQILKIKQNLTDKQKDMITQAIAGRMVAGGAQGASGLIQGAIADALASEDNTLFNQAATTYLNAARLPLGALTTAQAPKIGAGGNPFEAIGSVAPALSKYLTPAPAPTQTPITTGGQADTDWLLGGAPQSPAPASSDPLAPDLM